MVNWSSPRPVKVQLTIYVDPKVKQGVKVLATIKGTTTSGLIEPVLIDLLNDHPRVAKVLSKGD